MAVLVPSTRATLTVGGRVYTDLNNLIILHGRGGASGFVRSSMRKSTASSAYAAVGTFRIWNFKVRITTINSGGAIVFAYSDNDVGISVNTAFTNPVYIAGSASSVYAMESEAKGEQVADVKFDVPAGKYTGCQADGTNIFIAWAYGYEV